ncbi:DUF488 family protein [Lipingzhangella sp. LS1_29]|uniref:DUF488 family protein n=1 Tax=Lipingzhangella rawalii TaxID=2055835 RepID=A0ABU2H6R6_9ACTN|nr:DUF488 family protein [Lipingzhangella rawalii]MDS1270981.1 DUF488 family protein [Lipingzhangella rawalii]
MKPTCCTPQICRVYTALRGEVPPGARFLVDRLWPRGVAASRLLLEGWLREVAPSSALRNWFGHDPGRWEQFRTAYLDELAERPEAVEPILSALGNGPVVLLYAARDTEHNHALVLRDHVAALCAQRATQGGPERS